MSGYIPHCLANQYARAIQEKKIYIFFNFLFLPFWLLNALGGLEVKHTDYWGSAPASPWCWSSLTFVAPSFKRKRKKKKRFENVWRHLQEFMLGFYLNGLSFISSCRDWKNNNLCHELHVCMHAGVCFIRIGPENSQPITKKRVLY